MIIYGVYAKNMDGFIKKKHYYIIMVVIPNSLHRRSNSYSGSVLIFLFLTVLLFIDSTVRYIYVINVLVTCSINTCQS